MKTKLIFYFTFVLIEVGWIRPAFGHEKSAWKKTFFESTDSISLKYCYIIGDDVRKKYIKPKTTILNIQYSAVDLENGFLVY